MKWSKISRTLGVAVCGLASSTFWASPSPPIYQIIRGQYEDKIRRYSPPEKIFQVFAQLDDNQKCTMKLHELLKAICFYNYSESDYQKSMSYDPTFIKILMGKADHFDIYDYFNFVRFITYQRDKIRQFYADKQLNRMDRDSFIELMLFHICQDYDQFIREPIYIESRQFAPSKEEYLTAVKRIADSLFSYCEAYSYDELIDFRLKVMKKVMRQIFTFEFRTFKTENAFIDGVDFARSIVKYAENNYKRRFLRRIFSIEDRIKDIQVSESEYVDFHINLRMKEKELIDSLKHKGAINEKELQKVFSECAGDIGEGQIKVFFQLLDADNSEFIEKKEVMGVIKQLGVYWNVKPGENNLTEIARKRWDSFLKKTRRITDILLEE